MNNGTVILAGGSGFLGRVLRQHFLRQGRRVVVLTRHPRSDAREWIERPWDGRTLGPWTSALEGAEAVINLAGRSVDCRYHARNRRQILESRICSTRVLGEAIARCRIPPAVWLNSSTATIYRHVLHRDWAESGEVAATPEAQDAFSVEVATAWERTLDDALVPPTVRKVALRTAMVLGGGPGGVLPVLSRLVRWGLGGTMAGGRQYVSWIHERDFCRAIDWILAHPSLSGPVNLAAPNPVPNGEMMRCLRARLGRPWGLPSTRWMLVAGAWLLRTEIELVVKSRRVIPGRLLDSGFRFEFGELAPALWDLTRNPRAAEVGGKGGQ
jgi:hypothetical protein